MKASRVPFHVAVVCLLLLVATRIKAQSDLDALRYSQQGLYGTARFLGVGGSFGAIGGDFSGLIHNPAGIGVYRRNDMQITFSNLTTRTDGTFDAQTRKELKNNFGLNSYGLVISLKQPPAANEPLADWRNVVVGIGVNRLTNFNRRFGLTGNTGFNSLVDQFTANAQGITSSDLYEFAEQLAWSTYLIDTLPGTNGTAYYANKPNRSLILNKYVEQRGRQNETVLALGGNYQDKLFVGGSLNFTSVEFKETSAHTEEAETADTLGFESFTYGQDLSVDGNGFQLKLGGIFVPHPALRIGLALHSPTWLRLKDVYQSTLNVSYAGGNIKGQSPIGEFDYRIKTPLKVIGSVAGILKDKGFVNADLEWLNYANMEVNSNPQYFSEVNRTITQKYQSAYNLRLGAEYRVSPQFSVRAGAGYQSSPLFENSSNERTTLSGGIGYKGRFFYGDFTLINTQYAGETFYPYQADFIGPASLKGNMTQGVLTLGYRW